MFNRLFSRNTLVPWHVMFLGIFKHCSTNVVPAGDTEETKHNQNWWRLLKYPHNPTLQAQRGPQSSFISLRTKPSPLCAYNVGLCPCGELFTSTNEVDCCKHMMEPYSVGSVWSLVVELTVAVFGLLLCFLPFGQHLWFLNADELVYSLPQVLQWCFLAVTPLASECSTAKWFR